MSDTESTTDHKKRNGLVMGIAIILLLLVALFLCRIFDVQNKFLSPGVTSAVENGADADSPAAETEESDEGISGVGGGDAASTLPEITNPTFDEPKWFDTTELVNAVLENAARMDNGQVMYTFHIEEALVADEYTAIIMLPTRATVAYACSHSEKYPDTVNCFGPGLTPGIELTATLYAGNPNYSIEDFIRPQLLDARVDALTIDWSVYNEAAKSMGLQGEIDNPFAAWNVIGCCVMNSADGTYPPGCANVTIGDDTVPDFFGVDQVGNQGAADAIWGNLLADTLQPPSAPPTAGYSGEMIDEDTLLASANACAVALGIEGGLTSVTDARGFYDVVRQLDTRDHSSGSWGASLANGITGLWDDTFGFLFDAGFWSDIGEAFSSLSDIGDVNYDLWHIFEDILTDIGEELACSAMSAGASFGVNDYPDWCWDDNDAWVVDLDGATDLDDVDPADLMEAFTFPTACKDYVDYANENTYFPFANLSGPFGFGIVGQHCMDEVGMVVPGTGQAYAQNNKNELYDALIEAYEYTGNPAMPDSCRVFTDMCNSDQVNPDAPMIYTEGSMFITNGCNDPTTYAERSEWTDHSETPDCSFLEGDGFMVDAILNAYEAGLPYVQDTYCYQVWNQDKLAEEAFLASPAGQVYTCAETLGYNLSMDSVGDYMDFMTFLGVLDSTLDVQLANIEGCDVALDYAYWLGLTEQGITLAATSCDDGGPTQVTSLITFVNPKTVAASQEKGDRVEDDNGGGGSGAGLGGGGGGDACVEIPCPLAYEEWDPNTCKCEVIN